MGTLTFHKKLKGFNLFIGDNISLSLYIYIYREREKERERVREEMAACGRPYIQNIFLKYMKSIKIFLHNMNPGFIIPYT